MVVLDSAQGGKRLLAGGVVLPAGDTFQAGNTYTLVLTLDSGKQNRKATFDTDEWYEDLKRLLKEANAKR